MKPPYDDAGRGTSPAEESGNQTRAREFVSLHVNPYQPGVGTVLLSRPPTNALTLQMYRELAETAAEAGAVTEIDAVILFGGHEIFSAGDDVPELRTLTPAEAGTLARARSEAVEALAAIPKPTVAAVTGYALGSGLTLALAADWRIGGDNIKVGATEILAGLIPATAGMTRLARIVGDSHAKEMVFSGRFVDSHEAEMRGLIDELVAPDHVFDAAYAWAKRFVGIPAVAMAAAKAIIDGDTKHERTRYREVFAASQGCANQDTSASG